MKKRRKCFENFILWRALIGTERFLLWTASVIIVLVITVAVIMRYIFHSDFFGSEEILKLFAVWMYFIGGSYGSYEQSHITADILSVFVKSKKIMRAVNIFIATLSLVISLFFIDWAFQYWEQVMLLGGSTSGLKIPLPFFKFSLVVAFILMAVFGLYRLINLVMGRTPIIVGQNEHLLYEQTEKEEEEKS